METINLMNVEVKITPSKLIYEAIEGAASEKPITIATLNPEFILKSQESTSFKKALSQFTFHTVDGAGLDMMLRLRQFLTKSHYKIEKLRGSDLIADLLEKYQGGQKSFYFIGGPEGLCEQAKINIQKKYPKIKIVGAESGGAIDLQNPKPSLESINNIKSAKPDILIVGMGVIKQEIWIQKLLLEVSVPVSIGVGGTMGFYVNKKRAPKIYRQLNLEWLYRAFTEKGHYKKAFTAAIYFPIKATLWILSNR